MKFLYLVVILFMSYFLFRTITGVHISEEIGELIRFFTRRLVHKTEVYAETTHIAFKRMSLEEKRKSKKYKFYCFTNDILAAFGFKEHGVTVEGFVVSIIIFSILAAIALAMMMNAAYLCIFFAPMIFVIAVAGVFLFSRMSVSRRKQMLLDSMDILCSVMTDGILKAVKENIQQFPGEVQPYFERFLKNVELLNFSVPDAVSALNNDVGSLYDDFCASVITYEVNRASGMEELFNFYITENAKTTARDREVKRMSDSVNLDFFATIAAIAMFGALSSGIMGTSSVWGTPIGIIIIGLLVCMGIGVFIYIQYLLSKDYIYTERKRK